MTRSPEEGSQAERRADRSARDVVRGGYKLEESAGRPSRKSTRKSAIRAKSGSKLARRQKRRVRSPKARATRARAEQPRGMSGRA